MLIPYLARYRLSSCLSLVQGKWVHLLEQYLSPSSERCSQFLILQESRYFDFWLGSRQILRHPGHVFLSRTNPQQRRQFIPQGAIKSVGIVFCLF